MAGLVDRGDEFQRAAALLAIDQQRFAALDGGEEVGDLAVVAFVLHGGQLVVEGLDFGGHRGVFLREAVFLLPAGFDLPRHGDLGALALEDELLLLAVMDERGGDLPDAAVGVGQDAGGEVLHFGVLVARLSETDCTSAGMPIIQRKRSIWWTAWFMVQPPPSLAQVPRHQRS